jgi:hypothetical protein
MEGAVIIAVAVHLDGRDFDNLVFGGIEPGRFEVSDDEFRRWHLFQCRQ